MKLFACIAAVCAVPQRHLAPGLRDVEADGKPKWFVEDAGYPAQTSYDFEANKNPDAKPRKNFQTAMIFNLLCRGTPTDEFCSQGLEGVNGLIPDTFGKLFDLGKIDGDIKTKTDPNQVPIYQELMNFTPEELKSIWFHKMLKQEYAQKDMPAAPLLNQPLANLIQAPKMNLFRPMHFGRHQQSPIMSHFMWNRICSKGGSNIMCDARNSIKQQYSDYVKNIKNVYGSIYSLSAFSGK